MSMKSGEIAIISAPEHATGHVRVLQRLGADPIMLGANPTSIPPTVKVTVLRIEGTSHRGAETAHAWAREVPADRLLLVAKGAGTLLRQLKEHGLVKQDVEEEPVQAPSLLRQDYTHDAAWFAALLDVHGEGLTREQAQAIGRDQGEAWRPAEYDLAVRIWRASTGRPPLLEPEPEPPVQEVEPSVPVETGPLLNDLKASDYPSLAQWVTAVVEADPRVTVDHLQELAVEQQVKGAVAGTYSKAVRSWREAQGLPALLRGGHNAPRPAYWTETMGDDPTAWPTPRMRPLPSVEDLRAEVDLWREEAEKRREWVPPTERNTLQAARAAAEALAEEAEQARLKVERRLQEVEAEHRKAETEHRKAETKHLEQERALIAEQKRLKDLNAGLSAKIHTGRAEQDDVARRLDAQVAADKAGREETERLRRLLTEAQETIRVRERACAVAQVKIERLEATPAPVAADPAEVQRLRSRVEQLQRECGQAADGRRAEEKARRAADRLAATAQEDLQSTQGTLAGVMDELLAARARASSSAAPSPEAMLEVSRKVHGLLQVLGSDTSWEKLEAVLRFTL